MARRKSSKIVDLRAFRQEIIRARSAPDPLDQPILDKIRLRFFEEAKKLEPKFHRQEGFEAYMYVFTNDDHELIIRVTEERLKDELFGSYAREEDLIFILCVSLNKDMDEQIRQKLKAKEIYPAQFTLKKLRAIPINCAPYKRLDDFQGYYHEQTGTQDMTGFEVMMQDAYNYYKDNDRLPVRRWLVAEIAQGGRSALCHFRMSNDDPRHLIKQIHNGHELLKREKKYDGRLIFMILDLHHEGEFIDAWPEDEFNKHKDPTFFIQNPWSPEAMRAPFITVERAGGKIVNQNHFKRVVEGGRDFCVKDAFSSAGRGLIVIDHTIYNHERDVVGTLLPYFNDLQENFLKARHDGYTRLLAYCPYDDFGDIQGMHFIPCAHADHALQETQRVKNMKNAGMVLSLLTNQHLLQQLLENTSTPFHSWQQLLRRPIITEGFLPPQATMMVSL